ncbi:PREDICTED: fibrous sheath-interacting protein 1-like isoform X1 [Amphimedon queenslandica]|uniref:Fibrous sheath-interacting protein 1 n=2 Tax=Amphimedon queenslandica TaxID=400682 RepID=A0A1X7VRS8_AMPQE|nr:PREDICTED: fibrous sheath-interacting protein 1-like isoform X1 [Amphimedon queenslandica]|eukprot:XP_019855108.1 PREDICTED: fibrous sheath-interacting protein 1-like isoform X1 [Amphimedon queenslandica]
MASEGEEGKGDLPHNKMELLDKGSIEMYEPSRERTGKSERRSQLERLTPDLPFRQEGSTGDDRDDDNSLEGSMADIIFTSPDDFYKRLHDLADTVNREIAEKQNNSVKVPISTSLPSPISNEYLANEREAAEREEDEMAAKIKRAITKMKRLDSRLAELAKRERDVKRQRLSLEGSDGGTNNINSNVIPPLFETQPQEKDDLRVECIEVETDTHTMEQEPESETQTTPDGKHQKQPLPRFISRNKELAGQASEVLAMTEEEKKHLEKLLEEEEEGREREGLEEEEEEGEEKEEELGYTYSMKDLKALDEIDNKLGSLVPAMSSKVEENDESLLKKMSYGDKILLELHETRSELSRLAEIEKQLESMKNKVQDKETEEEIISLSDEQIQYLVKQSLMEQNTSLSLTEND